MSYVIGNIIGRILVSAFLVWVVLLLIHRFNISKSAKRLLRPLPILSIAVLVFLGLASHAVASTQTSDNDKQLFWVTTFPKVGVEEIYIPAEPQWLFDTEIESQIKTIRLTSQQSDDVAAVVELSQHAFQVTQEQFPAIRDAIVQTVGTTLGSRLKEIPRSKNNNTNQLQAFSFSTTTIEQGVLLQHQLDIFLENNHIWTFQTAVAFQPNQQFQTTRNKIFSSIRLSKKPQPTPMKG